MNPESGLHAATHKELNLDILLLTSIFPVGPAVGRQVQWNHYFVTACVEKRYRNILLVCPTAEQVHHRDISVFLLAK